MSAYRHILVGLDLSPDESYTIAKKAVTIAKTFSAKVSLSHIIEPLTFAYAADIPVDVDGLQKTICEHATKNVEQLVLKLESELDYSITKTYVHIGQTASELHSLAEAHEADLIIVGSHGRHGLSLLLGSTSTGVLHGAKCDVLAVRV